MVFGKTGLKERLLDIAEETQELIDHKDDENLREELGDLITSCYALAAERDWVVDDLVKENLEKVVKRNNQGFYADQGYPKN